LNYLNRKASLAKLYL